jgi:hypothetical protein
MVAKIEGPTTAPAIQTQSASASAFQNAVTEARRSPTDPPPKPKPQEEPSKPNRDNSGTEPDVQPMDPSRPDLWIGGPPEPTDPNHDGDPFTIGPPDDWQSNPGDVWTEPPGEFKPV